MLITRRLPKRVPYNARVSGATLSIQMVGIGLSAFITTLVACFLFLVGSRERTARAFGYGSAMIAFWAWFGFFYQITPDPVLARSLRIISLIGNALFPMFFVRFAFLYLQQKRALQRFERYFSEAYIGLGVVFIAIFIFDIFATQFIVSELVSSGTTTLAPQRGPGMLWFLVYFLVSVPTYLYVMARAIAIDSGKARRADIILFSSMALASLIGSAGFAPWFGIAIPALAILRALSVPLFALGAAYAISNYQLFSIRVATANFFVFGIWTFIFLRILLNESLQAAMPDIVLLVALIPLGILLIRSLMREIEDRLEIERINRERAIDRAKTEFISIAAHQLRTPLSGIRWTFDLLLGGEMGTLAPKQLEIVQQGAKRSENMVRVVHDLLSTERAAEGAFKIARTKTDLNNVVKETASMFMGTAETRGLRIEVSVPKETVTADIDEEQISNALSNLIDNAVKYTVKGSVRVALEDAGGSACISVKDSGIGMSDEDQSHLFEKFHRSKEAAKLFTDGSGLGLYIVKSIVEAHGGRIDVHSAQGEGTTFKMCLPKAR